MKEGQGWGRSPQEWGNSHIYGDGGSAPGRSDVGHRKAGRGEVSVGRQGLQVGAVGAFH